MNGRPTMSYRRWLVVVALFCCVPVLPAQPGNITPDEQTKINDAIDRGVRFLQATQTRSGTWSTNNQHVIGYTALPGLTLLECGVPPTDAAVQRAALLVRRSAATLDATYEVALSILFLDRLGNPADKPIIRMLAARLIAGQATTGGWSYKVPKLTQAEQTQMLSVLRQLDLFERPQEELNLIADGRPKIDIFDADGKPKQDLQAGGSTGDKTPSGFSTTDENSAAALLALFPRRGACIKSSAEGNSSVAGTTQTIKPAPERKVAEKPKQPPFIPPAFRNLPVFGNVKRQSLSDPPD